MAGITVSVSMGVMKPILAKLGALMSDECKKVKGLRKKVSFLERELMAMNTLLEKMDNADELDLQVKNWRKEIIEMSYDIEDLIDDFMASVGEAGDKVGILQKACRYLGTFKDRRRLANQLQDIKTLVIEASERRMRYKLDECLSNTTSVVVDPRLSALYKESENLVGIDTKKEDLVKWIMDEEQRLKVMSIVGTGGLGKTTLANEVYRKVGAQFNCKAFVSVSSKLDMMRLLNSILSQLELQDKNISSHVGEMDLINNIRKHLQGKRYFIVIDDLWAIPEWNNVISCVFPQNNQHSRVIVTTRNEHVATTCSGNHGFVHKMRPLSQQESRELFCNRIFGSEDNCPPHFQELSCEILKKCGGLPLAIVTVASTLACQPTRLKEQWEYIQNSLVSTSATKSTLEDMMHILELSYKNLPRNLKACFLYLGTYPEDYNIDKTELVRGWVAEGFVSNSQGRDIWDVADSYFNELANRSMIQPVYEDDYNIWVSHCRVHDMMLELIMRKCSEDNFMSVVNDPQMMAEVQDKFIRRLTVDLNGIKAGTMAMPTTRNLSKIRSLFIFGGLNWIPPLLEFKSVRVLFLDISGICEGTMDLTDINRLSQLRYLKIKSLWHCECKVLLGQIRSLQNLETLELSDLPSDCLFPSDIGYLPCLSHLVVQGLLPGLPAGIGKVKSLRSLYYFDMMESSLENIKGLGQLNNLANLFIYCGRQHPSASRQEVMAALSSSLEKLCNLKCLVVQTASECLFASNWVSAPFPNLERLDVEEWIFSRVPSWIRDLHNLRKLSLWVQQIGEEDVGVIGRLHSLVQLSLHIQDDIQNGRMVIGGSTGLKFLKFFDICYIGKSRLTTFEVGAMPSLIKLRLSINARGWGVNVDKGIHVGFQHLPSLKEIFRHVKPRDKSISVRDAFQEAAKTLPGSPALRVT